jgi:hypothetical protein
VKKVKLLLVSMLMRRVFDAWQQADQHADPVRFSIRGQHFAKNTRTDL